MMRWSKTDFEITHVKGSGPGGQHRNKRMTGIRLVHLPTGITVLSTERRSQGQNLQSAFERMEQKLKKYFYVPSRRVKTRPTKAAEVEKKELKTKRASIKRLRKKISSYDAD